MWIKLPSCGGALHITLSLVNDKYSISKTFLIITISPCLTGASTISVGSYIWWINQKSLSSLFEKDVTSFY